MNINISTLMGNLAQAAPEKPIPSDDVNPYLLNVLLRRLLRGENVTYGEVDFSQFEADDLRTLAGYCERRGAQSRRLVEFVKNVDKAEAFHVKTRAFC